MSAHPWERGRLARPACLPNAAATLVAGLILGLALGLGTAQAQTGGTYDLTWSSIDGGGGTSTGGSYGLSGAAGQPDASAYGALSGGTYALTGGYWAGAAAQYRLYLPLVVKSYAGGW